MRAELYQSIKSMNSWVFGMAMVLAVILTTGRQLQHEILAQTR
jgi:hypothetical protein